MELYFKFLRDPQFKMYGEFFGSSDRDAVEKWTGSSANDDEEIAAAPEVLLQFAVISMG